MGSTCCRRRWRSLGAALAVHHVFNAGQVVERVEGNDLMQNSFLGPSISKAEIEQFCLENNLQPIIYDNDDLLCADIAKEISDEGIIGWVRGRMEFGPRSLGARSIIASPFNGEMQRKINLKR